jgi:hypothetical protein
MRLPRAEEAVIAPEKLRRYALDPTHARGRHKARVFAAVLGIGPDDWLHLHDQILAAIPAASVRRSRSTPFGLAYEVLVVVEGLNAARASVITTWIVQRHDPRPRLTSTWVDIP